MSILIDSVAREYISQLKITRIVAEALGLDHAYVPSTENAMMGTLDGALFLWGARVLNDQNFHVVQLIGSM